MVSKEIEVILGGEKIQVWFNIFSRYELKAMYKPKDDIDFAKKLAEKANENELMVAIDLLKAGIKGAAMARKQTTPDVYDKIELLIAEMDMESLFSLWAVIFEAFNEHMGNKIKTDDKKKVEAKKK